MAFKMKGNPYKMGSHSTKKTMAYMKSPLEQDRPTDMLPEKIAADNTSTRNHPSRSRANIEAARGGELQLREEESNELDALLAAFDKKYPMEGPLHPNKIAEIKEKKEFLIEDYNEMKQLQNLNKPDFTGGAMDIFGSKDRYNELKTKLDNFLIEDSTEEIEAR